MDNLRSVNQEEVVHQRWHLWFDSRLILDKTLTLFLLLCDDERLSTFNC